MATSLRGAAVRHAWITLSIVGFFAGAMKASGQASVAYAPSSADVTISVPAGAPDAPSFLTAELQPLPEAADAPAQAMSPELDEVLKRLDAVEKELAETKKAAAAKSGD